MIQKITNLFRYADLVLLHFPAGVLAALIISLITNNPWEMIRIAAEAGAAKEIWDFGRTKTFTLRSFMEFVFTVLGGVAVAAFYV